MVFRFVTLLVFSLMIMACEEEKPDQIFRTVNQVIQAESDAEEFEAWNHSEYHPEKVFDDWLEWETESSIICTELTKLTPLDLTVFENQIRNLKYKKLLEKCHSSLIKRLDEYWKKEKESFPISDLNFKLKSASIDLFNFTPGKVVNQLTQERQVILTFDDGPHPEYTERLLKMLKQVDAQGVFFMLGKNVQALPQIVSKIANDGHLVGSHTDSHLCIAQNSRCRNYNNFSVNENRSVKEITTGVQSLIQVLGWTHPVFRFPFGESSKNLQDLLYSKGFFDFYWSVDSEDWKKRSLSDYYQSLIYKVDRNQGGNILFHDIHKRSVEVMTPFLRFLHRNNYTILVVKAKPVKSF